eukprot:6131061-Amphidinium_carterae.1
MTSNIKSVIHGFQWGDTTGFVKSGVCAIPTSDLMVFGGVGTDLRWNGRPLLCVFASGVLAAAMIERRSRLRALHECHERNSCHRQQLPLRDTKSCNMNE